MIDTHGIVIVQRADDVEQSGEQISLGVLHGGGVFPDPVKDLLDVFPADL